MSSPADDSLLMPWISGALIQTLKGDADYMLACGGRISSRARADVSQPYSTVQAITNPPIRPDRAAWRPLLQFVGWCPPGAAGGEDPAVVAWRMAANGIRAILRVDGLWSYDGWHGRFDVVLGPIEDVDITRGPDAPVYGARVHVEATAKYGA